MMLAMNRLGYDAMAVGNHEFNFGLKNLDRARSRGRKFPWLSANHRPAATRALRSLHGEDGRRRQGRGDRDHHAGGPDLGEAGESRLLPVPAAGRGGPKEPLAAAQRPSIPTCVAGRLADSGIGRGARREHSPAAGHRRSRSSTPSSSATPTRNSKAAPSAACWWCSRRTGAFRWRGWISRWNAKAGGPGSSPRRRAA